MKPVHFNKNQLALISFVLLLTLHGILAVSIPRNGSLQFHILHNNDMHARFDETGLLSDQCDSVNSAQGKCYGGMARVAYIVKKYRQDAVNGGLPVIFLNAGDTFTGTPLFQFYRDKIVNDFLNTLKPDAVSLGNHEFDLSISGLISYLKGAKYPVVTANMDLSRVPELLTIDSLSNYTVLNVNGVEIGVIGYVTGETKNLSSVGDIDFFDEVESINTYATELHVQGVDIIIALGHSGLEVDKIIAQNCPLVDLVIGGHSHTFLYSGQKPSIEEIMGPYPIEVTQKSGKKVLVVQAYAFTKYMGHLSVTFDENGNLIAYSGQPILLDSSIPNDDPEIKALLKQYQPSEELLTVVGNTVVILDGDCRFHECNFGNLFADAMVFQNALHFNGDSGWTDASVAIMQGGGIRSSITKGNITLYDLHMAYPFEHTKMAKVFLTGADLLTVLEHSVHRYDSVTGRGEFLQVSGLHVVYNLSANPYSRVHMVEVLCSNCSVPRFVPLNKTELYTVLMTSYTYEGGDGFDMFLDKKVNISSDTEFQYVRGYIEQMKIIRAAVEWRIKLIGSPDTGSGSAKQSLLSMVVLCFSIFISIIVKMF